MCLNLLAQLLPPGSLSRPRTFSSQPLQTKLMTHNGLFRPIPYLTAVSADEATASQQPPQAQLHRYNGLFRPSSCLPGFSPGPELSQVDLTRPSSCHSLASQGPAFASRPPSKTQLLLYSGLLSPSSDSGQPVQAQLLPYNGLFSPSSCLFAGGPNVLKSRPQNPGPKCPQVGLSRPSSCLSLASPGPAAAPRWPLQAVLFLLTVSGGPTPASEQPLLAQLLPSS
ncbi:LOW QUALITY PROTEIN: putative uncharacterized protein FLJ92257 [Pongo pygmaeus]|uniref:LOW QUALITY PROTEIN: putative uncharacterized protein FLJ92257 n=1 Tax=Pongo pygmaeus TaxID=9600 RepID=UPI0023E1AAA5|nr:LOW QUALITY PROTEIN: putative uncharacterized protein FLJ92257 [Pongo pygmaeus]